MTTKPLDEYDELVIALRNVYGVPNVEREAFRKSMITLMKRQGNK